MTGGAQILVRVHAHSSGPSCWNEKPRSARSIWKLLTPQIEQNRIDVDEAMHPCDRFDGREVNLYGGQSAGLNGGRQSLRHPLDRVRIGVETEYASRGFARFEYGSGMSPAAQCTVDRCCSRCRFRPSITSSSRTGMCLPCASRLRNKRRPVRGGSSRVVERFVFIGASGVAGCRVARHFACFHED